MNFPKIAFSILQFKLSGKKTPLKVTHFISYKCNLQCSFCGRRTAKTKELSTGQIKKMMKEFQKIGTTHWNINGGEPLLRPDIKEIINYGKELGFQVNLVTNGTILEHRLGEVKNADIIELSIDGDEKTHDKIRGKGSFQKTLRALEKLSKTGKKAYLLCVINKENVKNLEPVVKLAEKHNAFCGFQPVLVHHEDLKGKAKKYFPTRQEMQKAIDWILTQKKSKRPVVTSAAFLEEVKKSWPAANSIDCLAGKLYCGVTPEGFVVPCCGLLEEENDSVNGLKQGFAKAFQNVADFSKCHSCFYNGPLESNIVLNAKPSTILRVLKNILTGRIIWD